jgi:hypothetical protein
MIAISGSLTLLTNLVIAWNTQRMQETVDSWRSKGQRIDDDWLRRMDRIQRTPACWACRVLPAPRSN